MIFKKGFKLFFLLPIRFDRRSAADNIQLSVVEENIGYYTGIYTKASRN